MCVKINNNIARFKMSWRRLMFYIDNVYMTIYYSFLLPGSILKTKTKQQQQQQQQKTTYPYFAGLL